MTEEDWRPIPGYEGRYEVSDLGRVRSLDRLVEDSRNPRRQWFVRGKFLSTSLREGARYATVSLRRCGVKADVYVHQLVLTAFRGSRPPGMVGCHNDGDTANNRVSNLRWDTYSSNMFDAVEHGTNREARKTHCIRKHAFTSRNTYINPVHGGRQCKECVRINRRSRAARRMTLA